MNAATQEMIKVIENIPRGRVATYGQVARLAGYPHGARQVVRILNSCSDKYKLPWHRIINAQGYIALSIYNGADEQKSRLEAEGVTVSGEYRIDLKLYQWLG